MIYPSIYIYSSVAYELLNLLNIILLLVFSVTNVSLAIRRS
jgi:hypothetical protein